VLGDATVPGRPLDSPATPLPRPGRRRRPRLLRRRGGPWRTGMCVGSRNYGQTADRCRCVGLQPHSRFNEPATSGTPACPARPIRRAGPAYDEARRGPTFAPRSADEHPTVPIHLQLRGPCGSSAIHGSTLAATGRASRRVPRLFHGLALTIAPSRRQGACRAALGHLLVPHDEHRSRTPTSP